MIDPHSLELTSTMATLAANFLTEVARNRSDGSATAFHAWLENVAFPALRDNAEQTLATVISLKAVNTERYETLLGHVLAIRQAVGASCPQDRWHVLNTLDRQVLKQLYEAAHDDLDIDIDSGEIATDPVAELKEIERSARFLDEQGLLVNRKASSKWTIGPTPRGVWLAWAANAPTEFSQSVNRLKAALKAAEAIRLGELSAQAQVPLGLTTAQVYVWQEDGLINFADKYSPFEAGIVQITEVFRRKE